jgi:hypothetical protein
MYRYGSVLHSGARATFGVTRCEKGIVGQVLLSAAARAGPPKHHNSQKNVFL